ncbi:MAG TPA: polymer-forming cytoskeletal protein [Casimicrobiaceae bacterium]|jgi:cytoskeletal protein CcmA (bactofilin family)|nr:polymer-forming cytoskeletal protein [Casimicrobiaceae bacterium]
MLGFHRSTDLRDGIKAPLKPALYDPPVPARATAGGHAAAPRPAPAPAAPVREARVALAALGNEPAPPAVAAAPAPATATTRDAPNPGVGDAPGSKLFIGVNIKLKGVEISDCDVLVIEGQVDATVHSKLMQIASPGTLHGTALIDVAEIYGEFAGELTARTRLVVHGTGRVSGTIRYGKLIVAEGGELSGDVKRLDAEEQAQRSLLPTPHPRRDPAPVTGAGV